MIHATEDVPVERRLVLDFFYELFCPFCRRVQINIIEKMRLKNIVVVNPIDVDANAGSIEMSWYRTFCKKVESEPTPLIRLHDRYLGESNWSYVFLMWKKKPMTVTEEVLSAEEYLEKQLYDKIREAKRTLIFQVRPSYELDREMALKNIHQLRFDGGW